MIPFIKAIKEKIILGGEYCYRLLYAKEKDNIASFVSLLSVSHAQYQSGS